MLDNSPELNVDGSPSWSYAGVAGTLYVPHVVAAAPTKSRYSFAAAFGLECNAGTEVSGAPAAATPVDVDVAAATFEIAGYVPSEPNASPGMSTPHISLRDSNTANSITRRDARLCFICSVRQQIVCPLADSDTATQPIRTNPAEVRA